MDREDNNHDIRPLLFPRLTIHPAHHTPDSEGSVATRPLPPTLNLPIFELPSLTIPPVNLPQAPTFGLARGTQPQPSVILAPPVSVSAQAAPVSPPATPAIPTAPASTHSAPITAPIATSPGRQAEPAPLAPSPGIRRASLVLILGCVALLMYAAHLAMSGALLALGALFLTDLAVGARAQAQVGQSGQRLATGLSVGAGLTAAWALWTTLHQFSEMAFVAGLMVVPAVLVVLLVHGIASFLLRRDPHSMPSQVVRSGTMTRVAAALITLVAGYMAFDSFSARPDAYAAFAVLGLTAANLYYLVRSRA